MALGEKLRLARQNAKLTTAQVAAATRMKVQMIEDIEREDFRHIAAPIYGKGFIRLYAEKVGLAAQPLIEEYMERFVAPKPIQLVTERGHVLQGSNKLEDLATHKMDPDGLPPMAQEQDLFSSQQRGEPELPAEVRPARAAAEEDDAPGGPGFGKRVFGGFKRRMESLKEQVKAVNDPWRRRDFSLPVIRFVESPVKWISVAIGVLIVFILVISGVSSAVRHSAPKGHGTPVRTTEPPPQREQLKLGAEPPPPYVE